MTARRQSVIKQLFEELRERSPEERAERLRQSCGDDAALRSEVESLLRHHDEAGSNVLRPVVPEGESGAPSDEAPAEGTTAAESPANPEFRRARREAAALDRDAARMLGRKIGHYTIKSVIASGGMGTVFLAVQEQPRRTVALKVMKQGIASRSALRRFEYESQVLGRLRHPCIAQVYEAGTHDDGSGPVPYFAMEYVPSAMPLTEYAESRKLDPRERLELFARVCDAVHHGHQKGVIHRDLKPSNVLVDADGNPKIIDFGVARSTDSDMAVTTLQTDVGQLVGTLQYMSPEQCAADPHDVDSRSDVYALGVVLYELLCGRPPYDLSRRALHEAARVIREEPPTKPSSISRVLRGDVETITLKALEKERSRRYQSAADLGQDIQRYLHSEPIEARPPSLGYQISTFARRNRAVFASLVAIAAILVVATVVSLWFAVQATKARDDAEEALIAKGVALDAKTLAEAVAKHEAERAREAERLAQEAERVAEDRATEAVRNATTANLQAAATLLDHAESRAAQARLRSIDPSLRNWEWGWLMRRCDAAAVVLRGHEGPVWSVSFSPDGKQVMTGSRDGVARAWSADGGGEPIVVRVYGRDLTFFKISPGGDRIATASMGGPVHIRRADGGGEPLVLRGHTSWVTSGSFSFDGNRLATASSDGTVRVWNLDGSGEHVVLRVDRAPAWSASFSPDGTRIVVGSRDGTARVWNADGSGDTLVLRGHGDGVSSASFSPDGRRILTASMDGTARIWDADTGVELTTLRGHKGWASSSSFSPDGGRIATGSSDGVVRIWNADGSGDPVILLGHEGTVTCVAFSHDGNLIVTGSTDGTARVWSAMGLPEPVILREFDRWDATMVASISSNCFSPDGSRMVRAMRSEETVHVRRADGGGEPVILPGHKGGVSHVSFSPDGGRIVTVSKSGTVCVWNSDGGGKLGSRDGKVVSASFSPDGGQIVMGLKVGTISVWNADLSIELATVRGLESSVSFVVFSPDGSRIVTSSWDGKVHVWNADLTGEPVCLHGHETMVVAVSLSPDGNQIATAAGGIVRIWATDGSGEPIVLRGHAGGTSSLSFSPDASRVVTADSDGAARVWNADGSSEPVVLRGHEGTVTSASFSRDGSRIVTESRDGSVRIWDSIPESYRHRQRLLAEGKVTREALERAVAEGRLEQWEIDPLPWIVTVETPLKADAPSN